MADPGLHSYVKDTVHGMSEVLSFQEAIIRLNQFWADHGCIIWQPHNVQVGAGTMNPATFLRVLGPEPWNVGYVEPSVRPADGRYGENPNRWQQFYQYQVILKPDPGNPQKLCLDSLTALGIDLSKHDPRFVEDNWEAPGLGAWGLGWEVWLDGQEIAQFTYFQQAGGIELDPVSVEITYGLERIAMYLQSVSGFPEIKWLGDVTYGDVLLDGEIERCRYNFEVADVERLTQLYNLFEQEAHNALEHNLVYTAHDYVLKCSHVFNILDARGAIGVTERARYFARMRDQSRVVAQAFLKNREALGYPLWKRRTAEVRWEKPSEVEEHETTVGTTGTSDFVLEIGTEELPSDDLLSALEQLETWVPQALAEARLPYDALRVVGTPRRLAIAIRGLALTQTEEERVVKGPPARAAFDESGQPTRAAEGFARSQGIPVADLQVKDFDGRKYVVAVIREKGKPTREVLSELLSELIASLRFRQSMRWNETQVAFSRPIRWLVALLGTDIIPVEYAGVRSGRTTRGMRPAGSPELTIAKAEDYFKLMRSAGIVVDPEERRRRVHQQVAALAAQAGGQMEDDPALLTEVANLVEEPKALLGEFDPAYLTLPRPVLTTVMKKHQRYFPVVKQRGEESTGQRGNEVTRRQVREATWEPAPSELVDLLPCFITVANGGSVDASTVRTGNEEIIRARFADADFFYKADTKQPLADFVPRLSGLAFQEQLGSYLDKTERLRQLIPYLSQKLELSPAEQRIASRAVQLCKADLVTDMVVEFTSLQGKMGQEYALKSGEDPRVAEAIFEHYLPRFAGDELPQGKPGIVIGLADRLDSIGGLFAVGMAPTGSADPYGLRRAALGIVQILIGREINLSLTAALQNVASLLTDHVGETWLGEVLAFIRRRLQGWLLDAGYRYDLVEAVLAERGDNPYLAYQTVKSFSAWADTEEFARLLPAYSRSVRIVRDFTQRFELDPARFVEPTTERLYQTYLTTRERVDGTISLDDLFEAMLPLVDPINTFFDDVLVMHEDRELRENRLALLQRIADLPKGVVDLSKVMGF